MLGDRFTERGDPLGRKAYPARAARGRLHAIELPSLTPGGDSGHVHIEEGRRGTCTRAAITPLAGRTGCRAMRTTTLNVIDKPDPLNFFGSEGPTATTAEMLDVQVLGDLLIGLRHREFADAGNNFG